VSRSNPTERLQNPANKFFNWDGNDGVVFHYDKDAKVNVPHEGVFTFILLDELATIKGWHDPSNTGIYSNEVKDTRQEVLVVRNFAKETLAEGVYKSIKDKVVAAGGKYCASLYIAYKDGDELKIANLSLKGAGFGPWLEFAKNNRGQIYKKAICISGTKEGKKGKVVFQMPEFTLKDISEETNEQANELDRQLQVYMKSYLAQPKARQVDEFNQEHAYGDEDAPTGSPLSEPEPDDDSIPW